MVLWLLFFHVLQPAIILENDILVTLCVMQWFWLDLSTLSLSNGDKVVYFNDMILHVFTKLQLYLVVWSWYIYLHLKVNCAILLPSINIPAWLEWGGLATQFCFLLPLVLSDLGGSNFLPDAGLCFLGVAVWCLIGGPRMFFWGFCHSAASLVCSFSWL